jgi:hypothetical protein
MPSPASRAEIARRADSEQTLREIAARVSAILEPDEVLQQIVDETTRLLESDGARIDLYDPSIEALRWSYAAGDAMAKSRMGPTGGLKPGQAVAGTAFAEQRPARTDDYLTDERFIRDDMARAFVDESGIRSVICRSRFGGRRCAARHAVGRLAPAGAYDDADAEVLTAFATQALGRDPQRPPRWRSWPASARSSSVAPRRNRRCARSRPASRRSASRATSSSASSTRRDRLLACRWRRHRRVRPEEGVLVSAYDAGLTEEQRESVRRTRLRLGEGLSGRAMVERRVIAAGDYLGGEFQHMTQTTAGRADRDRRPDRRADHRRRGAARGDRGLPPTTPRLRRHRRRGPRRPRRPGGDRDHQRPARSRSSSARRRASPGAADTERALPRHHGPDRRSARAEVILERVVDEAMRLLGTDGAHLTRMGEDGTYLVPVVVDRGTTDPEIQAWLSDCASR